MISLAANIVKSLLIWLSVLGEAVASIAMLAVSALQVVLMPPKEGRKAGFAKLAAEPVTLRRGFAVLRAFAPNLLLKKQVITA